MKSENSSRKAMVYSRYLDTFGGGERSTLDCAIALVSLGFNVTIATTLETAITLEELYSGFDLGAPYNCTLAIFNDYSELTQVFRDSRYDLFVNHTFNSSEPNPALGTLSKGVYFLMFPLECVPRDQSGLRTYDHIFNISDFTLLHSEYRWPVPVSRSKLVPPVRATTDKKVDFALKEKLILNVGRFNTLGHNKNQAYVISEFKHLVDSGVLDQEWQLILVGRLNEGAANREYFENCKSAAQGYNINIVEGASAEELEHLYQRATVLWQFTGYGLGYGESPEICEHLGLVALDCFRYGTVPIVFERSGATFEILHGQSGFCFFNSDELTSIMTYFSEVYAKQGHHYHFQESLKSCPRYSTEKFTQELDRYCSELLAV